jgi:hypothetical protein
MTYQPPQQSTSPENTPTVPWAQMAAPADAPVTGRRRRIVEKLPDWEPAPPGEILVNRHRQD